MESDSSTTTQHSSVMLHSSTPRVKEELSVIDQSPETMNNAQVSPLTPGEMQSKEMIVQDCIHPAEVTHNQSGSSISPGRHPASNLIAMYLNGVSSASAHSAEVDSSTSENSTQVPYQSLRACINPVDVTDEWGKRTYMKTDSQHVDIDECFPRVKVQRMSQLQINTYSKQILNHSMLQQSGE